jgi:hypothetical protein
VKNLLVGKVSGSEAWNTQTPPEEGQEDEQKN